MSTKMTLEECYQKIRGMVHLKDGWDSYKAPAINNSARANAAVFCTNVVKYGLDPARVKPSSMGAVAVVFDNDAEDRSVFIEFYNSGSAHALFSEEGTTDTCFTLPVPIFTSEQYEIFDKIFDYLHPPKVVTCSIPSTI